MAINSFSSAAKPAPAPDATLATDAEDTISAVSWSPASNHLAVASWDNKVRIYDVASSGKANGVAMLSAEGPILSCHWSKDGKMVLAGGADKKPHLLDCPSGQQITVGSHDAPIRSARFVDVPNSAAPIIATGSWDKTIKFWDIRQQSPAASLTCHDRVYGMDAKADLLVVGTAGLKLHLVDLKTPTTFFRTQDSSLKHQTKVVTVSPDGKGWATGSIEGRCAMNMVDENDKSNTFSFKCHRSLPDKKGVTQIYTVNDVQFHPKHNKVVSTAGSDGCFHFWDLGSRSRIGQYNNLGGSITASGFSMDGSMFAYAIGYDWSEGHAKNTPQYPTKLMFHSINDTDATPKAAKKF